VDSEAGRMSFRTKSSTLRKRLYYFALLRGLKRRLKQRQREMNGKYYPVRWMRTAEIVTIDVAGYLEKEGKSEEGALDLLSRLYGSQKDVQSSIGIFTSASIIISAYVAGYVFDYKIPLSLSGITLEYNPTILAILLAFSGLASFKVAGSMMHLQIIKAAMSCITARLDPRLGEVMRSAYLYADNSQPYVPRSNPYLIVAGWASKTMIVVAIIAGLGILATLAAMLYIQLRADVMIFQSHSPYFALNAFLVFIAVSLSLAAYLVMLTSFLPIPFKNWSTNGKFQALSSDPMALRQFQQEVFGKAWRTERAIRKFKAKAAAL
jgi:hypothetical protein